MHVNNFLSFFVFREVWKIFFITLTKDSLFYIAIINSVSYLSFKYSRRVDDETPSVRGNVITSLLFALHQFSRI